MAELIYKGPLKQCYAGDKRLDGKTPCRATYESIRKMIDIQPTVTEAEIRAKVLDEAKSQFRFEYESLCRNGMESCVNVADYFDRIADQLKEERLEDSVCTVKDVLDADKSDENNTSDKPVAKKVAIPPCNACENDICTEECEYIGKEWFDNFKCPSCGSTRICMLEYDIRYHYCPDCGEELDWSEV